MFCSMTLSMPLAGVSLMYRDMHARIKEVSVVSLPFLHVES